MTTEAIEGLRAAVLAVLEEATSYTYSTPRKGDWDSLHHATRRLLDLDPDLQRSRTFLADAVVAAVLADETLAPVDRCGCRVDAELNESSVCPACGHRDHGRSGCEAPR